MKGWSLVYDAYEPEREGLREALCTLGNGYFATRGAASESVADGAHYPGTYAAGCYNRLETEIAGRVVENEDLVNLPNWLGLTFRLKEGDWFDLGGVEIVSYRQELDIRCGLLLRDVRFRDPHGRHTRLSSRRLVHMGEPHLAALETTLTPEDWSGRVELRSSLDGRVRNSGVARYRELNGEHLIAVETAEIDEHTVGLKVRTSQSGIFVAEAARTALFRDGHPLAVERRTLQDASWIAHELALDASQGQPITVEKVVALYTSRDPAIAECGLEARKAAKRAGRFEELARTHAVAWEQLWHRFEIGLEDERPQGAAHAALILRLHVFHLLQTTSPNTTDHDVGVPARGLHGEAYRGHIFWDELFVFPLLNLRMPEITRSLLKYRYRRLGEARAAAREAGYRGAMYPWQSGSNGREESQALHLNPRSGRWIPDNSRRQRHVSAAIAYNVWQYYQITGDAEFLSFYGAEMLLEIARFWASLATYNHDLDRYEILGVMGPDEYHDSYPGSPEPGLDNNAYTNVMAVATLCRALRALEVLPPHRARELQGALDLGREELARWEDVSRKMRVVFHDDGIISQFEGYDRLEEFDWEAYRRKYRDIQRLDRILEAEGDTTNRYKLSKQADVLMLFYLFSAEEIGDLLLRLGYPFDHETIPRNVAYYSHRTSHGSTLSRIVHSWVLARSDRRRSWQLFCEALESDVSDIQGGTTPEGIHLGAMAGTVDLVQRGYCGIEARGDALLLNPCLPQPLQRLHLHLSYRRQPLELDVTRRTVTVRALPGGAGPVTLGLREQLFELRPGETRELALSAPSSEDSGCP